MQQIQMDGTDETGNCHCSCSHEGMWTKDEVVESFLMAEELIRGMVIKKRLMEPLTTMEQKKAFMSALDEAAMIVWSRANQIAGFDSK